MTCPPVACHVKVIASPGSIVEGSIVKSVIEIGEIVVIFGIGEAINVGDGTAVAGGNTVGDGVIEGAGRVTIDGKVAVVAIDVGAAAVGVEGRVPQAEITRLMMSSESVVSEECMPTF